MDRPWLSHYPKKVPKEIKCDEFSSLVDFLDKKTQEFADRPAFSNMGSTLSYSDFEEKTRAFANYLHQHLKVKKGERIIIMLPNLLQTPIVIFGALRAGLIVVNTNPLYTPTELKRQLDDSEASIVVVLENFASVLAQTLPQKYLKTIIITRMGDMLSVPKALVINTVVKYVKKLVPAFDIPESISLKKALKIGLKYEFETVKTDIDDTAFLQYTGGTTGISKGAMLTHRNMLANMEQATTWVFNGLSGNKKLEKGCEIVVTPLPLYHIFALLANCMTFMNIGGMNYLITNPRDLPGFVKELKKIRFTAMTGVNTLFNGLLNTPGFDALDFSSSKVVIGGGMAIQKNIAEDWQKVTGCFLTEAYGLTETSPAVCINPLTLTQFKGSIGLPLPSTECTVHSEEGDQLPIGAVGEIYIRGPQVM